MKGVQNLDFNEYIKSDNIVDKNYKEDCSKRYSKKKKSKSIDMDKDVSKRKIKNKDANQCKGKKKNKKVDKYCKNVLGKINNLLDAEDNWDIDDLYL